MEKEIYDKIKKELDERNKSEEIVKKLKEKRNKISLTKIVKKYRRSKPDEKRTMKSDPTIKEYLKLCKNYKRKLKSLKSASRVIMEEFLQFQLNIKDYGKTYVYVRSYSYNGNLFQVPKDSDNIYLNEYWNIENNSIVRYVSFDEVELFKENNAVIELDSITEDNYYLEYLKAQKDYIIKIFTNDNSTMLSMKNSVL